MARPTKYKAEYAEQARKLCLLGATDADMAEFFEVTESTINKWKLAHKEFSESIKKGKTAADANVAHSLYKRATGYEQDIVKAFQYQGEPVIVPLTEKVAPDTTAAIFWLKNRQKEKWRDKHDLEHSGPNGGPIQHEDISDEKLKEKLEAMGFGREANQLASKAVANDEPSDSGGSKAEEA